MLLTQSFHVLLSVLFFFCWKLVDYGAFSTLWFFATVNVNFPNKIWDLQTLGYYNYIYICLILATEYLSTIFVRSFGYQETPVSRPAWAYGKNFSPNFNPIFSSFFSPQVFLPDYCIGCITTVQLYSIIGTTYKF